MNGRFSTPADDKPGLYTLGLHRPSTLLLWTAMIGSLIALAQDGEDHISLVLRLLYWWAHAALGLFVVTLVTSALTRWSRIRKPWVLVLLAGALGGLIYVPISLLLESSFAPFGFAADSVVGLTLTEALISEAGDAVPLFTAAWLLIQTPVLLAGAREDHSSDRAPRTGLLARLPQALGVEVIVLRSDLNYLHVTTTRGATMVLYSLRQAAEELDEIGIQIHRGVWIRIDAVERTGRDARGLWVELTNGERYHVSRRRAADVKRRFGTAFVGNGVSEENGGQSPDPDPTRRP